MTEHRSLPDSWQSLLSQAGEPGAGHTGEQPAGETRTRLAGLAGLAYGNGNGTGSGATGNGGAGTLSSSQKVWNMTAGSMNDLRGSVNSALETLRYSRRGSQPGDEGAGGLASSRTHDRVFASWEARIDYLRAECGELAGKLQKAGRDMAANDAAVRDMFARYEAKPPQPPKSGW